MFTGVIYWVVNNINGHKYIGQTTKNFDERIKQHGYESANPRRRRTKFHKAIFSYGWENFTAAVIESDFSCQEELDAAEIMWIAGHGYYNQMIGGAGGMRGRKHSEETRRKLRIARARYVMSDKTREKLRGRKHSPEALEKMRIANLGRRHRPEVVEKMRERRATPETKKKISETRKRMPRPGRGYRYKKSVGRWEAYTSENRKFKYIGMYATEAEAKAASDKAKSDFLEGLPEIVSKEEV